MSQTQAGIIENLLRRNGMDWMIDRYAPRDQAVPAYIELLNRASAEHQSRFGTRISFLETLQAEATSNPHKVQAFLQLLHPERSPAMLVMAWRVLQGIGSIREVMLNYRELDSFRLSFTLAAPKVDGGEQLEIYESTDVSDAALLRHMGVTKIGAKPLFDGFYALRLYDTPPFPKDT